MVAKRLAFSYVRFSSGKQKGNSSVYRQGGKPEAFCQKHNLTLSAKTYRDLGVSAWKGKNFDEGALRAFLEAVRKGTVPQGSVLVVEEMSRLTRETARKAQRIVEEIIEAGVTIATIDPERFYDLAAIDNPFTRIELLFLFVQNNEASKQKSLWSKGGWSKRRAEAATKPISGRLPAWCELKNGKLVPIADKAASVATIIDLCSKGLGAPAILSHLHKHKIPNPATGKVNWSLSYVQLLMRDRRAIGELQPCEYVDGKRKPIGPPKPNYFPKIIDLKTFNAAQAAIKSRAVHKVTNQGHRVNLFGGLIIDPVTKTRWVVGKTHKDKPARLQTLAARNKQAKMLSVDYREVENVILSWLQGLDLESLLPVKGNNHAKEQQAELADINRNIERLTVRLERDRDLDELITAIRSLKEQRAVLQEAMALAAANDSGLDLAIGSAADVIIRMNRSQGDERQQLRLQLKSHLSHVIREIRMVAVEWWRYSIGVLDIELVDGTIRREVTHKGTIPDNVYHSLLLSGAQGNKTQQAVADKAAAELIRQGFKVRLVSLPDGHVQTVGTRNRQR